MRSVLLVATALLVLSAGSFATVGCAIPAGDVSGLAFSQKEYAAAQRSVSDHNLLTASGDVSAGSKQEEIAENVISDQPWPIVKIRAADLKAVTTGVNARVAILDTGIDSNHPNLAGRVVAEVNFTDSPYVNDVNGHGTAVAGIIAAQGTTNGIWGMASGSELMNVKVADDDGKTNAAWVIQGIQWAIANEANIINISIELRDISPQLQDAIDDAWDNGILIVAAAGNDGSQKPTYPAYFENSVAVAGLTKDDSLAPLSNYGSWVDVAAPGFDIPCILPLGVTGTKSGTSFATAYVSGLAALLFSVGRDNNGDGRLNDEVRAAIEDGCQPMGISGVGKGRIDGVNSLTWLGVTR